MHASCLIPSTPAIFKLRYRIVESGLQSRKAEYSWYRFALCSLMATAHLTWQEMQVWCGSYVYLLWSRSPSPEMSNYTTPGFTVWSFASGGAEILKTGFLPKKKITSQVTSAPRFCKRRAIHRLQPKSPREVVENADLAGLYPRIRV